MIEIWSKISLCTCTIPSSSDQHQQNWGKKLNWHLKLSVSITDTDMLGAVRNFTENC